MRQSTPLNIFLVLLLVIAINSIASVFYFRIDATEEGLYTLSEGSKKLVSNLEKPITLKFYFSQDAPQVPLTFKAYGKQVRELLEEYQALAPDKLKLEVYNPISDSDEEEWAQKYGLTAADIGGGELFFLGVVAIMEDLEVVLPIFDPRREENLEYDISQLILQASTPDQGRIGIISSLPVMGLQAPNGRQTKPKWAFITELEKSFEIVELETDEMIPSDISTLILLHPKGFTPLTQYYLEQFAFDGGQLAIFLDPNARSDEAGQQMAQYTQAGGASSSLDLLFSSWGIDYDQGLILGDPLRPAKVSVQSLGVTPYYIWHELRQGDFNSEVIVTKDLQQMLLPEPGSFRLKAGSPLKLTSLIKASPKAGSIESYLTAFTGVMQINERVKADGKANHLAGIVRGGLTTAFADLPQAIKNPNHLPQGEATIFIMTDVDFIADAFSIERFDFLGQEIIQAKNDNLAFMINIIEYLGGGDELMEVRSRGKSQRPFLRFMQLEQQAQGNYQKAEADLEKELKSLQMQLQSINQGGQIKLNAAQVEQIKEFRDKEKATKSKLRKIRKLLRSDIEREQNLLILLNILLVPLILVIVGFLLYKKRFHRQGRKG